MGDMGDMYRDMKEHRRELRAQHGIACPRCKELRPKTNASILLPGQRCRVDGYKDLRPRVRENEVSK
jgi:ribosomal protein L40E